MGKDTKVVRLWRFAKLLNQKKISQPLALMIYYYIRVVYKCYMPLSLQIGENLKLVHNGIGCIFNDTVIIGNDVEIYPNCMLVNRFSSKKIQKRWAPVIGNDVTIGGNSTILGDVKIGNRSVIGAGSVITNSVPADYKIYRNKSHSVKKII